MKKILLLVAAAMMLVSSMAFAETTTNTAPAKKMISGKQISPMAKHTKYTDFTVDGPRNPWGDPRSQPRSDRARPSGR